MSIPSLVDKGVLLAEVEVVARLVEEVIVDGSDPIIATCVPNGSENVVAPDFAQQL